MYSLLFEQKCLEIFCQSIIGQHHKISFKETDKYVSSAGDRNTEVTAYGAGGSYSLQIQVKVPLQTPYSSKRGGSGGYDGSLGQ